MTTPPKVDYAMEELKEAMAQYVILCNSLPYGANQKVQPLRD